MRKRYRQDPKTGKIEFVGEVRRAAYASDTFAVGDIPDKMKDIETRKKDLARAQKQERLNTIIQAYNQHN